MLDYEKVQVCKRELLDEAEATTGKEILRKVGVMVAGF